MQEKNKINLSAEQTNILKEFEKNFLEFNKHTNLISKNDEQYLFERHILDSLALNIFLEKYNFLNSSINIIDAGTGGGFPALPLAFCNSKHNIVAIDSIKKKINFIESIKTKYKLTNIHPYASRLEDLSNNYRDFFDIGTSRALAKINTLIEYLAPYIKIDGYIVAYKSKLADIELNEAKNAMSILGVEIVEKIQYNFDNSNIERNLIILKKTKKTPPLYPRKNGLPKKNPL